MFRASACRMISTKTLVNRLPYTLLAPVARAFSVRETSVKHSDDTRHTSRNLRYRTVTY